MSADYARRGVAVPPARIALTASTSEAYALLFKLLCDPGDRVLVPRPSYPLFEHLTALECVSRPCPTPSTRTATGGSTSTPSRAAIDARTKAVLVVSPNNPTGSVARIAAELDALADAVPPRAAWRSSATRCSPTIALDGDAAARVGAAAVAARWRSAWAACRSRSGCRR